jgi:hypothetical protein
MKTSKYYRLNNNYSRQKGGTKRPGAVRRTLNTVGQSVAKPVKKFAHNIAVPLSKPFVGESGDKKMIDNGSGTGTQRHMTPKELIDTKPGFFTTKSTRLRQAQEAAVGLSLKDQKRAAKITNNSKPTTPLSINKEKKRQKQAFSIAEKLGLNTKGLNLTSNQSKRASYEQLQSEIKDKLAEKKKTYAEQTFQQLEKTKEKQKARNNSKLELNTTKTNTSAKTDSYTKQKEITNLLETLKQFPKNKSIQDKLMNLDPNTYKTTIKNETTGSETSTFKENSTSDIDSTIATAKANLKEQKKELKKAFEAQNKAAKSFRNKNEKLEKHTRHYGTVDDLKKYSNKKSIAQRASKVGHGAAIAAGIAGLGAASIIAPPVGIAATAAATAYLGKKIKNRTKYKSTLLKTLNSSNVTASNKETARNLIVQKTNSAEAQYKLNKALAKGEELIGRLGNQKNSLLAGTYQQFKNNLKNYSTEDYSILKDYYKANKIKEIREGTKFANTSTLGKTKPKPSFFSRGKQSDISNSNPFTKTTEQRLQSYTEDKLARLPKNSNGTLQPINAENYKQFLPLLSINTTNKSINNKQLEDLKQTKNKIIDKLEERYKNLKNIASKNPEEWKEFYQIEQMNKTYKLNLGLQDPLPPIPAS